MINLISINIATAKPLLASGRKVLSAIGKRAVSCSVAVERMGLVGDEQADLSVHGGLEKAVYAYPQEHYGFWQAARREHGASLFEEDLPHGFMGENLTISGLLEADVFVGDELAFANCRLRVEAPREPCFKFAAVMGFAQAGKLMVQEARCGFYLSVVETGNLQAGESFTLIAGARRLSIADAIRGKMAKHRRD
ncbi:MOSC domain-containing protein [Variovorax sp. PCZ-1]|uniref:MOSC domain-containing protein n=1 Tax=Variovorax sp. PCZ-1 TaxID=2835533 RepID=UPI001BCFB71A|nr:MOSC domain-containing protein [Variovorax sp. PCZ-1]MBS7808871.1 MOSC domain-containing protein [Variovorax sp. PCZ-1]